MIPPIDTNPMDNVGNDGGIPNEDMGGDLDNQEEIPQDNVDLGDENTDENDPKKDIQRLTGKLSQELQDYNSENQDDSELNKYVINMLVKQTTKHLSSDDKDDVINKIENSDEDGEEAPSNEEDFSQEEEMTESVMYKGKTLDEIIDSLLNSDDEDIDDDSEIEQKLQNSPFSSNR